MSRLNAIANGKPVRPQERVNFGSRLSLTLLLAEAADEGQIPEFVDPDVVTILFLFAILLVNSAERLFTNWNDVAQLEEVELEV